MSCRGCGGHGLDIELSPRQLQVATQPIQMHKESTATLTRPMDRVARVSRHEVRGRGTYAGPLAQVMAYIEDLHRRGYEEVTPIPFGKTWACKWCHGTGSPQLSAHTLEQELKAHDDGD